jgi:hypothetical protein
MRNTVRFVLCIALSGHPTTHLQHTTIAVSVCAVRDEERERERERERKRERKREREAGGF